MKPDRSSARSERGGTPTWAVPLTLTVRARNSAVAQIRVARWAKEWASGDLAGRDSLVMLETGEAVRVDG